MINIKPDNTFSSYTSQPKQISPNALQCPLNHCSFHKGRQLTEFYQSPKPLSSIRGSHTRQCFCSARNIFLPLAKSSLFLKGLWPSLLSVPSNLFVLKLVLYESGRELFSWIAFMKFSEKCMYTRLSDNVIRQCNFDNSDIS